MLLTETFWESNGKGVIAVLSLIVGAFLSYLVREALWTRKAKLDLRIDEIKECREILTEVSEVIGDVHHKMLIYAQSLKPGSTNRDEANQKYSDALERWNSNYLRYHSKVRLVFGDECANMIVDFKEATNSEPRSLHYQLKQADAVLLKYASLTQANYENDLKDDITLERFNDSCVIVVYKLTTKLSALTRKVGKLGFWQKKLKNLPYEKIFGRARQV